MKKPHQRLRFTLPRALVPALTFILPADCLPAAVISQVYGVPLMINAFGAGSAAYRINGTIYRFDSVQAPVSFDFDRNGSTDLTISSTGQSSDTSIMFATQHGRNQVWSLAGRVAGLDFGSHALSLAAGSTLGPSLHDDFPRIGWHNDDDTRGTSILMQSDAGRPVSGTFFPSYLFEKKYLGFRFERDGALHYGWMEFSAYAFYGTQIYAYSWAYESEPNTPLIVGQIPEPTLPALLAGAVCAAGIRRRRGYSSGL